jgi:hypothetical protein
MAIHTVVVLSVSALVMSVIQCRLALARAGAGVSSGRLGVEGRRWRSWLLYSRPSKHRGGARSGFGLFGLSSEQVLEEPIRTSDVSVDSVDAMLEVLEDDSLAVEPESRGICPCSMPKDLAKLDMA